VLVSGLAMPRGHCGGIHSLHFASASLREARRGFEGRDLRARQRHCVAECLAIKHQCPVRSRYRCLQFCHRLVRPDLDHLYRTGNVISRPDRSFEGPVHVQEHTARPRQILGNNGVQDGTGDAALHNNATESGPSRKFRVIVQRVAVSGDGGEQLDIPR
jgi:hypothetical protein